MIRSELAAFCQSICKNFFTSDSSMMNSFSHEAH